MQDNVQSLMIDLDITVDVTYTKDDPFEEMENGKYYPVTILDVSLRGSSIYSLLHVSHILALQRRVYFRLLDTEAN